VVSLLLGHNPWRVNHVVPEGTEQLSFCNFTLGLKSFTIKMMGTCVAQKD